jgi:hypothetical protein
MVQSFGGEEMDMMGCSAKEGNLIDEHKSGATVTYNYYSMRSVGRPYMTRSTAVHGDQSVLPSWNQDLGKKYVQQPKCCLE